MTRNCVYSYQKFPSKYIFMIFCWWEITKNTKIMKMHGFHWFFIDFHDFCVFCDFSSTKKRENIFRRKFSIWINAVSSYSLTYSESVLRLLIVETGLISWNISWKNRIFRNLHRKSLCDEMDTLRRENPFLLRDRL